MTSNSNTFFFLGAAVVGIVSAAGMYFIEHFRQERRRHAMAQNLVRIDQQLLCMQKELEQLRKLQKEKNAVKSRKQKLKSISTASDDFRSVTELDSSDLEFYDLSDEENITTTITPTEATLELIDDKLNDENLSSIKQVVDQLTDLCLESPENPQLLWRLGKAHYKLANLSTDLNLKNDHIKSGINACQSALNVNPDVGEAHKWMATLVGLRSGLQPIKEKIGDGFLFKQHLDKAQELLPNDSVICHMLGRFAYETASLKWYERKVASTFFAEPPSATFDEALKYFIDADRLTKTDWKENKLFIAKCQIALGKYKEAISTLKDADMISNNSVSEIDTEVQVLLQKYNSYS